MPQKNEIYVLFYRILKALAENFIKTILQEMKYGLSLRQQQLQVITLSLEHFISWDVTTNMTQMDG